MNEQVFTIGEQGDPAFYLKAGLTPSEALFFVGSMFRAPDCKRFTVITISTEHPEDVEVSPVENWAEVAGSEAVTAFDSLVAECETLPHEEAIRRYGNPGWRIPGRGVVTTNGHAFHGCETVLLSLAYAVRFRSPDGEIVVSNILGDVFIEEVV